MHMHFNQLLLGHRYQKIAWQLKLTTEKLNKSLEPPQSPGVVANGTTVPSVNKLALEELVGIVNFHLLPLTPSHTASMDPSVRATVRGALKDKDLVGIVRKRTPPCLWLDYAPDRISPSGREGVKDVVRTLNNTINVMRSFPHPCKLAMKAKLSSPQFSAALDNCYSSFAELSGPKAE